MSRAGDRERAVPCRQLRYRIYVDGALCAVEKHKEMDMQDIERFKRDWAAERLINDTTVEVYPWMDEV